MFKDCDTIIIECEYGIEVNENTLVCVSPYDSKNEKWICGLNEIMPLSYALKLKKNIGTNNKILGEFIRLYNLYIRDKLIK